MKEIEKVRNEMNKIDFNKVEENGNKDKDKDKEHEFIQKYDLRVNRKKMEEEKSMRIKLISKEEVWKTKSLEEKNKEIKDSINEKVRKEFRSESSKNDEEKDSIKNNSVEICEEEESRIIKKEDGLEKIEENIEPKVNEIRTDCLERGNCDSKGVMDLSFKILKKRECREFNEKEKLTGEVKNNKENLNRLNKDEKNKIIKIDKKGIGKENKMSKIKRRNNFPLTRDEVIENNLKKWKYLIKWKSINYNNNKDKKITVIISIYETSNDSKKFQMKEENSKQKF